MTKRQNNIRQNTPPVVPLDDADRTLLRALSEDAGRSYSDLGELVHLSPPATHQRVRRMREAGIIRRTTVDLDFDRIGLGLCAFILVNTDQWAGSDVADQIAELTGTGEIHTIAGDANLIVKIRCPGTKELEATLKACYEIKGVTGTRTFIALNTHYERQPLP